MHIYVYITTSICWHDKRGTEEREWFRWKMHTYILEHRERLNVNNHGEHIYDHTLTLTCARSPEWTYDHTKQHQMPRAIMTTGARKSYTTTTSRYFGHIVQLLLLCNFGRNVKCPIDAHMHCVSIRPILSAIGSILN